jgi:hypothetical protein
MAFREPPNKGKVEFPGIYHFRVSAAMLSWLRSHPSPARLRWQVSEWMNQQMILPAMAEVPVESGKSRKVARKAEGPVTRRRVARKSRKLPAKRST